MRQRVSFIGGHNSARSQIAEEYLRRFAGDRYEVASAGLEPGAINPLVAEALLEKGIDIRRKQTHGVTEYYRQGRRCDWVIAVCGAEAAERCPVFPGGGPSGRLHWPFDDPSHASGGPVEKLAHVRRLRDQIKARILQFIDEGPGKAGTAPGTDASLPSRQGEP